VLFLDEDLKVRFANKAYRRIWEVPEDYYAVTRTLREDMEDSHRRGTYGIADEDWPGYLETRLAEIAAGPVPPREITLATGRTLEFECMALPGGGRMLNYYDITATKEAAAKLRQHLEGMEVSMDGMALLDPQGRYTYVNAAHAEFYGFRPEEMVGMSWRDLYDDAQLAWFDRTIFPHLQAHGRWRGEATGRRKSGRLFPQELSLAFTNDGGIVCVVRDITERKHRERVLDQALKDAEQSNVAKLRFLASMSHELRTPLNAVIGFTRIVARRTKGTIPEQQSDNLAKIQTSAEHLLKLINEILDISKIEAGRMEVARAPFSPAGVVEECLRTIEPMVAPGVRLQSGFESGLDGASGDSAKVRQIVTNLLGNAARHTRTGTISVRLSGGDGRLRIAVEDTGPGIPEDARDRIFEEFAQAQREDRPRGAGTGLGLTISRRLARLMGGDIAVESTLGQGSTFTLDLPFQLRDEAETGTDQGAAEASDIPQ